jgi:hypothetical protein
MSKELLGESSGVSQKFGDSWKAQVSESPSGRFELVVEYDYVSDGKYRHLKRRYRAYEVVDLMRIGVMEIRKETAIPESRMNYVCSAINDAVFDAEDKVAARE